ncbi:MAG: DUF547 domain-containing protein [Pseudomonadales bacterium]|nr:DUF547 domain-containing protein [Pseudomonadales bacterium]
MRMLFQLALLIISAPLLAFDHGDWDTLLNRHVSTERGGVATTVNYGGMAQDRDLLKAYLASLSAVSASQFDNFHRDQQLAFLINAYNAFTVELILLEGQPASIRDIGSFFSGPWDKEFFSLLGKPRTLDELEHEMIRGNPALMDPRIHFAVNCASVGCPALRPEAYTGERLESQLADSTRRFLGDRTRNRFDLDDEALAVSKIFDWYEEDFSRAAGSLSHYLLQYADTLGIPARHRKALEQESLTIQFLPYDWALNSTTGR